MPKIQLHKSTKSVKKESRKIEVKTAKENKRKTDEDSENR